MIERVGTSASPLHDLLLGLAGRVDDDLLGWARELLAVGEAGQAVELVSAALVAEQVALPPPLREAVVAAAGAAQTDLDVDGALPRASAEDGTPHRFSADAASADAVVAALTALPERRLAGCTLHLTWRCTPAGAAPGPVPWAVVLVEAEPDRAADVLAYLLATELERAGAPAAVEVFPTGAPLPAYHVAALEGARAVGANGVRTASAGAGTAVSDRASAAEPDADGAEAPPTTPADVTTGSRHGGGGRDSLFTPSVGADGGAPPAGAPRPLPGRRRRADPADPPPEATDLPAGPDDRPSEPGAPDVWRPAGATGPDPAPDSPPDPTPDFAPDFAPVTDPFRRPLDPSLLVPLREPSGPGTPGRGVPTASSDAPNGTDGAGSAEPVPRSPVDVPQDWDQDWRSGDWAMPRPAGPAPDPVPSDPVTADPTAAGTPVDGPVPADSAPPAPPWAEPPAPGTDLPRRTPAADALASGFTWNLGPGSAAPPLGPVNDPGPGFTWNNDFDAGTLPRRDDPRLDPVWSDEARSSAPVPQDDAPRSGSPWDDDPETPPDHGRRPDFVWIDDREPPTPGPTDGSSGAGPTWDGDPGSSTPATGWPGGSRDGGRHDLRDDPAPSGPAPAAGPDPRPPTGSTAGWLRPGGRWDGAAPDDADGVPPAAHPSVDPPAGRGSRIVDPTRTPAHAEQSLPRRTARNGRGGREGGQILPLGARPGTDGPSLFESPTGRVDPSVGGGEPAAGPDGPPRPRPRPRPNPLPAPQAEEPTAGGVSPDAPPSGGVSFHDDPLFGPAPDLPPDHGGPLLSDAPTGPGEPGRGPGGGPDRPEPPEVGLPRRTRRPGPGGALGRPPVPEPLIPGPARPADDGDGPAHPAPPPDAVPAASDGDELSATEHEVLARLQADLTDGERRPRPYRRAGRNGRAVNGRAHPGGPDGGPPDLVG
ncbi:MAG TPA: hypothetical protein VF667_02100 [Pseudonocardia sp.]